MKKYFIGTLAVVIAIASAAFTTKPKNDGRPTDYYFAFNTSLAFSEDNVQNEGNWLPASDADACTGSPQKACVVKVPESLTDPGTPRTLSSSANLVATEYMDTDIHYVSSAATNVTRHNKSQ